MTVTATGAETTVISRAQAVHARAELLLSTAEPGTITSKARETIREHARWLANSLDVHRRLALPPSHPDYLHPASEYPSLAEGWPDDALGRALRMAADDAATDSWVLAGLLAERWGPETAEYWAEDKDWWEE